MKPFNFERKLDEIIDDVQTDIENYTDQACEEGLEERPAASKAFFKLGQINSSKMFMEDLRKVKREIEDVSPYTSNVMPVCNYEDYEFIGGEMYPKKDLKRYTSLCRCSEGNNFQIDFAGKEDYLVIPFFRDWCKSHDILWGLLFPASNDPGVFALTTYQKEAATHE